MSIVRILTLTLLGCVAIAFGCAGVPAEKSLDPFLEQFEHEVGVKPRGVHLYFKDLPEEVAGRCILGVRIVQINKSFFNSISYIEQKALMFHEITHCVCSEYGHAEPSFGCGNSIMEPRMKSFRCYEKYWGKYMKDLRKRCK